MSQAIKRIKREHDDGQRKEDKHALISGQFMTSSFDDDPGVDCICFSFCILTHAICCYSSRMECLVHRPSPMPHLKIYHSFKNHLLVMSNDELDPMDHFEVYFRFYV